MARFGLFAGVVAFSVVVAGLSGCVGYTTYSLEPGSVVPKGPNSIGVNDVIVTGMSWVIERFPPSGKPDPLRPPGTPIATETFALNLPYGLNEESTRIILRQLGPGAQPMLAENVNLPIYHVAYLRIRGDEADMHVFRPLMVLGVNRDGQPAYQEMRLKLRGGARRWRVQYGLNWTPGSGESPPLNFIERPREPGEYLKPGEGGATPAVEPAPAQPLPSDSTPPSATDEPAPETQAQAMQPILIDLPSNPIWDEPLPGELVTPAPTAEPPVGDGPR